MKVAVIFLTVLISGAVSLTCKNGTDVIDKANITTAITCDSGVTKCYKPKAGDNNSYKNYGCGECDTNLAKDTCETCASDACNTFEPATYALKCYINSTDYENCTGKVTNGCFNVKPDYAGTNEKLKNKFGGCGTCEDSDLSLSADADKKACQSCAGDLCNGLKMCTKPAAVANISFTPATDIANGASYTYTCSANTDKFNYTLIGDAKQTCEATAFTATLGGATRKCNATALESSASKAGPVGLTVLLVLWYLM